MLLTIHTAQNSKGHFNVFDILMATQITRALDANIDIIMDFDGTALVSWGQAPGESKAVAIALALSGSQSKIDKENRLRSAQKRDRSRACSASHLFDAAQLSWAE